MSLEDVITQLVCDIMSVPKFGTLLTRCKRISVACLTSVLCGKQDATDRVATEGVLKLRVGGRAGYRS
jgi:hypothetical protein